MINTEYDAENLVEEFINIFVTHINFVNKLNCTRSDVIVLNSSNTIKNSFHLIFKSVVFANNQCCKQFIQCVLKHLSPADIEKISYIDSCVLVMSAIPSVLDAMSVSSPNVNLDAKYHLISS